MLYALNLLLLLHSPLSLFKMAATEDAVKYTLVVLGSGEVQELIEQFVEV